MRPLPWQARFLRGMARPGVRTAALSVARSNGRDGARCRARLRRPRCMVVPGQRDHGATPEPRDPRARVRSEAGSWPRLRIGAPGRACAMAAGRSGLHAVGDRDRGGEGVGCADRGARYEACERCPLVRRVAGSSSTGRISHAFEPARGLPFMEPAPAPVPVPEAARRPSAPSGAGPNPHVELVEVRTLVCRPLGIAIV